MPGVSGVTVVTNARVYYTPRAAAGASGARHSLRPLFSRGRNEQAKPRAKHAARSRTCISTSLPATNAKRLRKGAQATTASAEVNERRRKQSTLPCGTMDCFASARNDGCLLFDPNRIVRLAKIIPWWLSRLRGLMAGRWRLDPGTPCSIAHRAGTTSNHRNGVGRPLRNWLVICAVGCVSRMRK